MKPNDELRDELRILFAWIVGMIVVVWLVLSVNKHNCYKQYREFNPTWGAISGCIIEYNGMHIPSENFRIVD